jgi:hypothetical protein
MEGSAGFGLSVGFESEEVQLPCPHFGNCEFPTASDEYIIQCLDSKFVVELQVLIGFEEGQRLLKNFEEIVDADGRLTALLAFSELVCLLDDDLVQDKVDLYSKQYTNSFLSTFPS